MPEPAGAAPAPPRRRGRRPEALLALSTLILCTALLLLAELVLRRLHPDALDERPEAGLARLHRYSEVYGWELRPGARATIDGHPTSVNRWGQRGVEHGTARAAGRERLVLLGDSVAFGYGVGDEETFAARLERDGFDVVNLAVPGYGTDQELLRLQGEGLRFSPQVVLLHFCLENDFVDNVSPRFFYDDLHPKPFFALSGDQLVLRRDHLRLSPWARLALWLRERSQLLHWLRPRALPQGSAWQRRKADVLGDEQAARALSVRLVQEVARVTVAGGARFVLVLHPSHDSFQHDSPGAEALRRAPLPPGARVIDLAPAYRERGLRFRDVALESVGHLNARGHAVTAELLEAAVRGLGP